MAAVGVLVCVFVRRKSYILQNAFQVNVIRIENNNKHTYFVVFCFYFFVFFFFLYIEPGVIIAIAGLSNGLGGAMAANVNVPVISCLFYKDYAELAMNLNSSVIMPSGTPNLTVVRPDNAAQAALRALNLPRLRERLSQDILATKAKLRAADEELRVL